MTSRKRHRKRHRDEDDDDVHDDNSHNKNNKNISADEPPPKKRRLNENKKKKNKKNKHVAIAKSDVIKQLKSGDMVLKTKSEFNKHHKKNVNHWESFRHVVYAKGDNIGDAVYSPRGGYWVFCNDCKNYEDGLLSLNSDSTTNGMKAHLAKKCSARSDKNKLQSGENQGGIGRYLNATSALEFTSKEKEQIREDITTLVALNQRPFSIVKDEGMHKIALRFYNLGVKKKIFARDISLIAKAFPDPRTVSGDVARAANDAKIEFIRKVILKELNEDIPAFGLTADLWKEKYTQLYYVGITIAFWAGDGKSIETLFLACKGWKEEVNKLHEGDILMDDNKQANEQKIDYGFDSDSDYDDDDDEEEDEDYVPDFADIYMDEVESGKYSKTGENIKDVLLSILAEFLIVKTGDENEDEKISDVNRNDKFEELRQRVKSLDTNGDDWIAIATDLGADILKAVRLTDFFNIKCANHRINKALEWALKKARKEEKELNVTIHNMKKTVKKIKQSGKMGSLPKTLKNYVKTRWDTFLFLFQSILESFDYLCPILISINANKYFTYNKDEVRLLFDFLLGITIEQKRFQSKTLPTIHHFIPTIDRLEILCDPDQHLCTNEEIRCFKESKAETKANKEYKLYTLHDIPDDSSILALKTQFTEQIDLRLKTAVTLRHWQAVILNPFTKKDKYFDANAYKDAKEDLKKKIDALKPQQPQQNQQQTPTKRKSKYDKKSLNVSDELAEYLNLSINVYPPSELELIDKNPMEFWTSPASEIFPTLRIMARNIFISPASSAPSETIFSCSGNTIGKKRTRLSSSKVDLLIFLGSWLRHRRSLEKK